MNKTYRTDEIARFYGGHRLRWEEFYPSERTVFEQVAARFGPPRSVLDAGCAAGGLGLALQERFSTLDRYVGVDVNPQAISVAQGRARPWQTFICADVGTTPSGSARFQWVVSLSCVDWNLAPIETIRSLWACVAPGGLLILSLRLTDGAGTTDPAVSRQRIVFEGDDPGAEVANYVVFNVHEAIGLLAGLGPDMLVGYGYWGPPSRTAVTPYERLAFTVFAAHRSADAREENVRLELGVPSDLLTGRGDERRGASV
ncbi:MAG TPA: class I SAM-dependent methyltransferase [Candidatus Acidoferrum sp.]|nr:class I SAM-dependent methyltransferase [Candidatus Acidoferrum sp.]